MTSRVAVIGPGSVGLTFAAALSADHEVVAFGRRARVRPVEVELDGVMHRRFGEPVRTDVAGLRDSSWDWALLAVKAHQTLAAADWLRALPSSTAVAVFQNGVEQRETVAPYLSGNAVVPSIVWAQSEFVAEDRIVVRGELRVVVPDDEPGRRLRTLFDPTPATVECSPDFQTAAWRKLITNAVAGLQVLTGRRAEMYHDDAAFEVALALADECGAVARADGAAITPAEARSLAELFREIPRDLGTSILFDREANVPLEWNVRNGVVQRRGRDLGIPTPVSDVIVPLLRAASGDNL